MSNKRTLVRSILDCLLVFLYFLIGYHIAREESLALMTGFFLLFGLTALRLQQINQNEIFWLGLVFRLILLFALPWLSQDFYRFLWDGLLMLQDINPYAFTPDELVQQKDFFLSPLKQMLHQNMGALSASHYSNYPPINQVGFAFSVYWWPNSLLISTVIMRVLIIIMDLGVYHYGRKLLQLQGISQKRMAWYFLNPLVIIELTGNLHWEGGVLFFFTLGCYLYLRNKPLLSAAVFALSVATKLIPLLFLPVFIRFQSVKKNLQMGSIGLIALGLIFVPFFIEIGAKNYMATLQLWFKNFEFNGSLYYIARWIGYQIKGYNIIRQLGEVTPWLIVLLVILFSLFKRKTTIIQVFTSMLLLISCYYFVASVVHPWYLIPLLFISLFTKFRYVLVWTFLIPLSYTSYAHPNFEENFFIIAIEYGVVYGVLVYELLTRQALFQHFK